MTLETTPAPVVYVGEVGQTNQPKKRRRPQATSGTLRGLFEAAGVTLPARHLSEDGGGGGSLQQDGEGKRPKSPKGTARGHLFDILKHGFLKRRRDAWGG